MSSPHLTALPQRLARWSARHPGRAIGLWALLVLLAVGLSVAVPSCTTTAIDTMTGESRAAAELVRDAGLQVPSTEYVLITAAGPPGTALDATSAQAAAAAVRARLATEPTVAEVAPEVRSPDGSAILVPVRLRAEVDDVSAVQGAVDRIAAAHPGVTLREAGDVSVGQAVDDRVAEDLASAELTSLPVTLVLMLLAFGALIAAGIPVLLAGSSVAATIGVMAPLSHLVPNDPSVASMIVLIGMAVGVDYSLFYLARERAERRAGRTTREAVDVAARTSGHSILVSGGAVIVSMTGLLLTGSATFASMAVGSILVVAVAVLGSLTVLPALLVALGPWVDRPRVPLVGRLARLGRLGRLGRRASRDDGTRVAADSPAVRLLGPVLARPAATLVVAGAAIGALCVPALGMSTHSGTLATLPQDLAPVRTLAEVTRLFPADEGSQLDVVVTTEPGRQDAARSALRAVAADASSLGLVDEGVRSSADGATSVLMLSSSLPQDDPRVAEVVDRLRSTIVAPRLDPLPSARHAVGGSAAETVDFERQQDARRWPTVAFVLALTSLLMLLAFRAPVIALVSAGLNLASVGVAFGVLTLVFQHGWLVGLLGVDRPGFVVDWIPLFVLVVLVGLSMDYHVFVLGRVRELLDDGLEVREAVRRGIGQTAGVVTSAAVVMVSVFAIFATLSLIEMKMLGVGLAVAIAFDATVIRLVVLPALLTVLGPRAWSGRGGRSGAPATLPARASAAAPEVASV